ncbi:hypothetical protein [Actinocrispum wychmicini]|uniref:Uncharacterized protein n=1 Tax=Actinocrispum wychmicini TaxID=1213861 RepID=A0A4V6NNV6_9PSEU|nr:hypothetical protein [Actinocrispum wychmicini]TCO57120.1 hypothetical protein EV192_106597 [Actinocrispum wychmicini]
MSDEHAFHDPPALDAPAVDTVDVDKVTLPSGGWARLADPRTLRTKHQKAIMRAGNAARNDKGDLEYGWATTETLMKYLVTEWNLPYRADPADDGTARDWVLPSQDMSILDELTPGDYRALLDALEPARKVLFPKAADPSDYEDPDSPTEPASGSGR